MRSRIHNPKSTIRRGFTLIELIVVIIIMAVLSAVAVPSYTRLRDRSKFDGSVQQIISLYRWAREAAVESGLETTVSFDQQTGSFIAVSEQPEVIADMPTTMLEQREQEQQHAALPPRIYDLEEDLAVMDFQSYRPEDTFASNSGEAATTVRFRHDGSCDGGRLILVSASGYRAVIEIAAATGKPSIIEEME
jgi:prepilin-type N-terminal cleavage/methylation domain-containing protein